MTRLTVFLIICLAACANAAVVWSNGNWALACDFPNRTNILSDLKNINSSDCGGKCAATKGCTHFAWSPANGGTCGLKKNAVSKSQAVTSSDKACVCGVMDNASATAPAKGSAPAAAGKWPSAGNGKTTRYWDCCKPYYSLPGMAAVTAPVTNCAKDGVTKVSNDDKSVCDGGTAHVCNNQVPFVVNASMAYGFAAAVLSGLTQQDVCCACYKIDFTSGPVVGKSMIVQVINTGADLGENHFDLQIPGGGVGIFNSCSPQWNASADGWGERYGGISKAEECKQLPTQIRGGCDFRFGWFKDADNPDIKFKRVECPAGIIARTGCNRQDE